MPDIGRWHTSVVISNISCRSTGVADQLPVWCRQDGTSSNEPCQHPRSDSLLCLFVCLLCVFLFSYIVFFNFFIICICLSRQEETQLNKPCQHRRSGSISLWSGNTSPMHFQQQFDLKDRTYPTSLDLQSLIQKMQSLIQKMKTRVIKGTFWAKF